MKPKLSVGVCLLICLALVAFGVVYGATAGFRDERAQVQALLTEENGLMDVLDYCGADALNLCVVAERHMAGDADVQALHAAGATLRDAKATLSAKRQAMATVQEKLEAVAQKLGASESFLASERDVGYLRLLRTDVQQLTLSPKIDSYNEAAAAYNELFSDPFSGFLGRLTGAKPCELLQ